MEFSTKIISLATAILMSGAVSAIDASAANPAQTNAFSKNLFNLAYKSHNDRMASSGQRFDAITRVNNLMDPKSSINRAPAKEENPQATLGFTTANTFGDIDAPNGETWFYTLDLENEAIEHELYTDYELKAFTVTIYDAEGKEVGSIHDKMRYQDDEVVYSEDIDRYHHRVPLCEVLGLITTDFFNDTPDYEVVVAFAVNTPRYVNHYRSVAYSIGGAKDEEGNDVPVGQLPELIADVLQFTDASGRPSYYFSLVREGGGHIDEPAATATALADEDEDEEEPDYAYWERLISYRITIDTYKKAGANGVPEKVFSYTIPLQQMPGDQESGGYMLSRVHNGEPYMIFSKLREPLTEPYYSPYGENMTQRAGNTLEIEIYKINNDKFDLVQKTSVPFEKEDDDDVIFTYCGIGMLRWDLDVDFDHYGTPEGKAAFIVQKCNYRISSDGVSGYTFQLFDHEGNRKKTIARDVDGYIAMTDLPGQEPQEMFISYDGSYVYDFVDLYSFTKRASIPAEFSVDEDSDPELLMSNIDRVAFGETYKYAAEMRYPIEDEGDTYLRIAWFDEKGRYDRVDNINMGENVYYAMPYISSDALNPNLFHSDDAYEYMLLVKRGIDETGETTLTQEELMVAQPRSEEYPQGRTLLHLTPDENRGVLGKILPYINDKYPRIAVSYSGLAGNSIDFYYLPLDGSSSGIDEIEVDNSGVNPASGDNTIYNLQGIRVDKPGKGLYIVNGQKTIFK